MNPLRLTLACLPYDHVQPLTSGEVRIEGVELAPIACRRPMDVFSRMLANNEFDIAEMSLIHCFILTMLGRARFVALPVYPSRMFRHGFIFVNTRAGVTAPKDLEAKRIGVQGYQTTAAVWIRGILQREYGVSFDGAKWFEGGVNQKGVAGGQATRLRPDSSLAIESIGDGTTLSDALAAGEIDALIGPEVPHSLHRSGRVRRLFPDYHAIERDYYARTGIFPIMHALVLKDEVHRAHPWLATNVCTAFERSKQVAHRQARFTGALSYMLPWQHEQIEEIDQIFGPDPWPYGIRRNRSALEAFAQFLFEQRFTPKVAALDEVFLTVPELESGPT
jgi:4,5-dihydroxyphthalate decarboxylase